MSGFKTNAEHEVEDNSRRDALRLEFEANPRAYARKYGTINSYESAYLVNWLLERVERPASPEVAKLREALEQARAYLLDGWAERVERHAFANTISDLLASPADRMARLERAVRELLALVVEMDIELARAAIGPDGLHDRIEVVIEAACAALAETETKEVERG